jgi:hypothetical protein
MKKITIFFLVFLCTFQLVAQVRNYSTNDLRVFNTYIRPLKIERKIPAQPFPATLPAFLGNITTDTLAKFFKEELANGLVVIPSTSRVVPKPTNGKIELYEGPFSSVTETENPIFKWKNKAIYTQKWLINWASPSIQLLANVDEILFWKMTDVSINPNGFTERYTVTVGTPFIYNNNTFTVTAYRPFLTNGHTSQQGEITIQYTKK